jgi:hypothetical protein
VSGEGKDNSNYNNEYFSLALRLGNGKNLMRDQLTTLRREAADG